MGFAEEWRQRASYNGTDPRRSWTGQRESITSLQRNLHEPCCIPIVCAYKMPHDTSSSLHALTEAIVASTLLSAADSAAGTAASNVYISDIRQQTLAPRSHNAIQSIIPDLIESRPVSNGSGIVCKHTGWKEAGVVSKQDRKVRATEAEKRRNGISCAAEDGRKGCSRQGKDNIAHHCPACYHEHPVPLRSPFSTFPSHKSGDCAKYHGRRISSGASDVALSQRASDELFPRARFFKACMYLSD